MKRKLCALISAVFFAMCCTTNASAAIVNDSSEAVILNDISCDVSSYLDESCYDFSECNSGISICSTNLEKSLNVQHYYQDGQTWSDDYLGTSTWDSTDTIGSHGCLVTSVAMVHRFMGGVLNPRGINNQLKRAGLNTDNLWITGVANTYGWTEELYVYHVKTAAATAISEIKDEIDAGRPVIVGLAKFNSSNVVTNTHFVVAYGYNGNTIYINDPYTGYDYDTLNQYFSSWSVYNLRSFSK